MAPRKEKRKYRFQVNGWQSCTVYARDYDEACERCRTEMDRRYDSRGLEPPVAHTLLFLDDTAMRRRNFQAIDNWRHGRSRAAQERIWQQFIAGGTSHSAFAMMVPYLIERCEAEGLPYELQAVPGRGYAMKPRPEWRLKDDDVQTDSV